MADKLLGARLKLERADKHIADLDAAVIAFKDAGPCKISRQDNPDTGHVDYVVVGLSEIPASVPLIAGDAIFNLRSALDHTAMQLWLAAGGSRDSRIYFPIASNSTEYGSRLSEVKRFGDLAIKVLQRAEAYKGGTGHQLWVLHELNNTDKHRLLLTVGAGNKGIDLGPFLNAVGVTLGMPVNYGQMIFPPDAKVTPLEVGDVVFADASKQKAKLDKNVNIPIEIAFRETQVTGGDPIVKTLHDLSKLVAHVIDQLGRLL